MESIHNIHNKHAGGSEIMDWVKAVPQEENNLYNYFFTPVKWKFIITGGHDKYFLTME